jgi:adenylylsulfate kinase
MEKVKLLIFGLPGSGKTSLAKRLSQELNCVWFNGDETRSGLYPDLGFSEENRIQQSRRMSFLCDIVLRTQDIVIADFVCPNEKTRVVFSATKTIFMDTIEQSRFEDTNKLFQKPTKSPDFIVKTFKDIEDLTSLIGIIKM